MEGFARGSHGEAEGAGSVTRRFGRSWEGFVTLSLGQLRFPWHRYARTGVTVSELLTRTCFRPDLRGIRRAYEAGLAEEAVSSVGRLLAEGEGGAYQVPDEIPGDRIFAFRSAEAEYVHGMASVLFGKVQRVPEPFMLPGIAGLYISPCPYAYSKARVFLQKSTGSLMRLHAVAVAHHDWAAYRGIDEADDRVFRSSTFVGALTLSDSTLLPTMGSFSSPGIHPLLLFILKHFGCACTDGQHPARALPQHN